MNRLLNKGIFLTGVLFCLFTLVGTYAYGQVELLEDINMTGFPTDETLLSGESSKEEKTLLEIKIGKALPLHKTLKEASVKRKIAEKEPMGNLHQMQKMSQYPDMDISREMKRLRNLQWTGRGLWIAGTAMVATGILFYGLELVGGGSAFLSGGLVCVGIGIPMDVVYTRKIKTLRSTKNYSASLDFGNQNYGVGFGLHF